MKQCLAVTWRGTRCSRRAFQYSRYCVQHLRQRPVEMRKAYDQMTRRAK